LSEAGGKTIRALAVLVSMIAWAVVLLYFGRAEVFVPLAGCALGASALLFSLDHRHLIPLLSPSPRAALVGLSTGALMTALTYPAYAVGVRLVPSLAGAVEAEYTSTGVAHNLRLLPLMVVIVFAEELLWRGSLVALMPRAKQHEKALVSVLLYTASQAAHGSTVVVVVAAACGTIWVLLRLLTQSLLAPLLSHLIWTVTVMVLVPVAG
jgi:membrane protease YdiL (CAAX protease family)